MKVIIYVQNEYDKARLMIDTIRTDAPNSINDVVLVDMNSSDETRAWASLQTDFTYVYFDEEITWGSAFNQVVSGLEIHENILFLGCDYLPLKGCITRLESVLEKSSDILAVGPVCPTFRAPQNCNWVDYDEAEKWSIDQDSADISYIKTMCLYGGAIAIRGSVFIEKESVFDESINNIETLFMVLQMEEFLKNKSFAVCKNAALWDIRGNDFIVLNGADPEWLENRYGIHYFNTYGNAQLIDVVSEYSSHDLPIRILEIGCDCGGTLFRLKQIFPKAEMYGCDINPQAVKFASVFSTAVVANIQELDLTFGRNEFDYIIFADVLEHLTNPLEVIKYCKKLLGPGGRIVASIPNLMNITVIKELLDGNFTYTDVGLLDRTHIHLFTYNEIVKMFKEAGCLIEEISGIRDDYKEYDELINNLLKISDKSQKFMYDTFQFIVVAKDQESI